MINIKDLYNLFQEANKVGEYQKILELIDDSFKLREDIEILKEENKKLREDLKFQNSLVYENNAYWIKKEGKKEGPFCSRCWDIDKNPVRMNLRSSNHSFHSCPGCNKQFQTDPGYQPSIISRRHPMSSI